MDISLPELNGLDATARITKQHPRARVLVRSMHSDEEYVAQALRLRAAGYLLKDASSSELETAIRAVARGYQYLSPAVARPVVEQYLQHSPPGRALDRLSPRQREVLQLIAQGHGSKEMAQKLELSVKTVETHRARLMKRLDARNLPGLVRYAIKAGLVSLDC